MKQNGFFAEVIKTDIISVDKSSHGLPPHKGAYPEFKVADYYCPEEWTNDGVFIPVKEGDPLWFNFQGNDECAILCAVQRINPATGKPADLEEGLSKDPAQNYLRMPEQRWLDGYAKEGKVYQFVVTKAGIGLAVNEYVLPKHMQDSHAIGFAFFGPKNPKPKVVRSRDIHHYEYYGQWSNGGFLGSKAKSIKYGGGGMQSLSAGGGSQTMGFGPEETAEIMLHDCGSDGIHGLAPHVDEASNSDNVFCCNNTAIDRSSGKIDRVTNDYADEEAPEIETVDILAEQEANLNELDKASMGAGGRIHQEIETDDNTTDYYHEKRSALLTIYFALPEMYDAIMQKGKRQDSSKKDKYKTSGHIGGVAVPLINQEIDQ